MEGLSMGSYNIEGGFGTNTTLVQTCYHNVEEGE